MKEIILHIGYSKCASSSIQGLLTKKPSFINNGKVYRYVGFNPDGSLMHAKAINKRSYFPPRFFTSNISNDPIMLKEQLKGLLSDPADVVILSNEGLANPGWLKPELSKCFSEIDVRIKVFLVLRRFDTWLNASWWQWGAFSKVSLENWIAQHSLSQYELGLQQWLALPNVQSLDILDITENPVGEFASRLGLDIDSDVRVNTTSSADMMRFLVKNQTWLKRKIHNPLIEFILNEEVDYSGRKPPLVVSHEKNETILKEYEAALGSGLEKKLERLLAIHLADLTEKINGVHPFDDKETNFSMKDFLDHHQPSPEFLLKLNEVLTKRLSVPANFSAAGYLHFNPDVKEAGVDPYQHYLEYGAKEGRRIR